MLPPATTAFQSGTMRDYFAADSMLRYTYVISRCESWMFKPDVCASCQVS